MAGILEHDRPADAERVQRHDGAVHPHPAGRRGGSCGGIGGRADDRAALRAVRARCRMVERPLFKTRRDARRRGPATAGAGLDLPFNHRKKPAARALRILRSGGAIGILQPGQTRHQQGIAWLGTPRLHHRNPTDDRYAGDSGRTNRHRLAVRSTLPKFGSNSRRGMAGGSRPAAGSNRPLGAGAGPGMDRPAGAGARRGKIHPQTFSRTFREPS